MRRKYEGVCLVRTFCGQGGSSDADVRTFWRKNLRIFRNLWCVRTDKGGGGQFFVILCGRLLMTVPMFMAYG